jgi:glycosyltransferase involved in cell wall biosynthesis
LLHRRVLIITYYWPPIGGSGVQRWLKFAKYLPEFNWQPVIYTPENPDNGLIDQSLLSDIPEETEVLKTSIWDPSFIVPKPKNKNNRYDGYSVMETKSRSMLWFKWIRGNLFIPDSRVVWTRPSVSFLMKYLKTHPVDLIITTGPPHSLHLIGANLNKKTKIKWIMDLRDPMSKFITNQELRMTSWALAKYRKIESRLLKQADAVIATSPGMPKMLASFDENKFHTITNGYDAEDFSNDTKPPTESFVMTHAGLLNQYRIPIKLLEVVEDLLQRNDKLLSAFEFRLAGIVSDSFWKVLENFPLVKSKTIFLGYLAHADVLNLYKESTLLLLLMNDDSAYAAGTIPGKLFECFAARRPLLSLGPKNSVYAPWLDRDPFSSHIDYEDKESISKFLSYTIQHVVHYSIDENKYPEFERKQLTHELVQLLNQVSA